MRLLFVDTDKTFDFDAETPYQRPLGGSQSCLCYLAAGLARRGHEVFMMTGTREPHDALGVHCLSLSLPIPSYLVEQPLDAVILLNGPAEACLEARKAFPRPTPLVLWNQLAPDQPSLAALRRPEVQAGWDMIVCLTNHHLESMRTAFAIEPGRLTMILNGMAPAFENLFRDEADLMEAKAGPPVLAYTSTPFRGLDVLLHLFPQARQEFPDLELRVFSGMQVYQVSHEEDPFTHLYQQARSLAGVRYVGSVPQPDLARELRRATILAYPNTFAETFCIAAVEAAAAGAFILTSDLGALPEVLMGHGRLVKHARDSASLFSFAATYLAQLQTLLTEHRQNPRRLWGACFSQVQAMNARYSWSGRVDEWEKTIPRWRIRA